VTVTTGSTAGGRTMGMSAGHREFPLSTTRSGARRARSRLRRALLGSLATWESGPTARVQGCTWGAGCARWTLACEPGQGGRVCKRACRACVASERRFYTAAEFLGKKVRKSMLGGGVGGACGCGRAFSDRGSGYWCRDGVGHSTSVARAVGCVGCCGACRSRTAGMDYLS